MALPSKDEYDTVHLLQKLSLREHLYIHREEFISILGACYNGLTKLIFVKHILKICLIQSKYMLFKT